MSAQDRIKAAHQKWMRDFTQPSLFADALLDLDPHLAQDIADGEALRRLREAHDGRWFIHIHESDEQYVVSMESFQKDAGWLRSYESASGATIAEAADACRAALEARK